MMDIVLIHGLSGSTADMQYIADKMIDAKYNVSNIALPGHGTKPEDLLPINMQNWIDEVESQINTCAQKIVIVGQSMGALLSLYCAVKYPDKVKGVVLLSPAIRLYGGLNRLFMSLLYMYSMILPIPEIYYKKVNGADIANPEVKKNYWAYNKIPLKTLAEFERLRRLVLDKLYMVTVPVLIVYSINDHTIAHNAVEIIDKKIGSTIKNIVVLNKSFHVISVDMDKDVVVNTIFEFQRFIETGVT